MSVDRWILLAAALLGLSGLVIAAAGSHMAPGLEDFGRYRSWQSANTMHLVHALALLFLSSRYLVSPAKLIGLSALFMGSGVLLFSGSIYLSQLDMVAGATRVAPAGGVLMMAGWLILAVHAIRSRKP